MPAVGPEGEERTDLLAVVPVFSLLTGTVTKSWVTSPIWALFPTGQFTFRTVLSNGAGAFRTLVRGTATAAGYRVTLMVTTRTHLDFVGYKREEGLLGYSRCPRSRLDTSLHKSDR